MYLRKAVQITLLASLFPFASWASRLTCPDAPADMHKRETMATSAPEVKARISSQNDGRRWSEITKPMLQKAIKQSKLLRAAAIQEGVEHACKSNELFVSQMVPVSDKPSGCGTRIVTRPADDEHIWVQAVAVCRYDWTCCVPDEGFVSPASPGISGSKSETPAAQPNALPQNSASTVQSTATMTAPAGLKK